MWVHPTLVRGAHAVPLLLPQEESSRADVFRQPTRARPIPIPEAWIECNLQFSSGKNAVIFAKEEFPGERES